MRKVTFYLLDADNSDEQLLACQLAAKMWRAGKRVLIACQSQQQAEMLDELLWQFDTAQFVPHNLAGEGPKYGAPVEICWPEKRGSSSRNLLINLLPEVASFASSFTEVIDFVSNDEQRKQQARERYKTYRSAGYQLETLPAPNLKIETPE